LAPSRGLDGRAFSMADGSRSSIGAIHLTLGHIRYKVYGIASTSASCKIATPRVTEGRGCHDRNWCCAAVCGGHLRWYDVADGMTPAAKRTRLQNL
jgi:hypothetical protein